MKAELGKVATYSRSVVPQALSVRPRRSLRCVKGKGSEQEQWRQRDVQFAELPRVRQDKPTTHMKRCKLLKEQREDRIKEKVNPNAMDSPTLGSQQPWPFALLRGVPASLQHARGDSRTCVHASLATLLEPQVGTFRLR